MRHSLRMVFLVEALLLLVTAASAVVHAEDLSAEFNVLDVIIIGAGACGLAAGKTLSEKGVTNFLILEATDRIGGRVRYHEFAGIRVELGANWVEGVDVDENGNFSASSTKSVNPVLKLAQEVGLVRNISNYGNQSSNVYNNTGMLPNQALVEARLEKQKEFLSNLSISLNDYGEDDMSVKSAQRLSGWVPSTPTELALEYHMYDGEFAEPPRVTSLRQTQPTPTYEIFGKGSQFVHDGRGFVSILHHLACYLNSSNNGAYENVTYRDPRLKLNTVVTNIAYNEEGVITIHANDTSTHQTSKYTARNVILTVSMGVLQSSLIKFEPDLPPWKRRAMYQYDMAIYTKIFLQFNMTFWPTGPGTEFFIYAGESRGYYTLWQHLDAEYPNKNIIFVTITDLESIRIEQQPEKTTKEEIMGVLKDMFGSNIPCDNPIDLLKDMHISCWWSNPYFRGSYSNWPIGISHQVFDKIRAPINHLYFAGEHTSPHFNGYIHGALLEGEQVAEDVEKCLRKKLCFFASTKKSLRTMGLAYQMGSAYQ